MEKQPPPLNIDYAYAHPANRLGANFLDVLVLGLAMALPVALLVYFTGLMHLFNQPVGFISFWLMCTLATDAFFYSPFFDAGQGTPGKRFLGQLLVHRPTQKPPAYVRLVVRALLRNMGAVVVLACNIAPMGAGYWLLLGLVLMVASTPPMFFNSKKTALYDIICQTAVIEKIKTEAPDDTPDKQQPQPYDSIAQLQNSSSPFPGIYGLNRGQNLTPKQHKHKKD